MVKVYTAFTTEIDDAEAAVRDILSQLAPDENMLGDTLGIINFYYEFVDTGVYQAIADALPFETAGCLSSYIGTCGKCGDVSLSVTMITGDDIRFSVRTVRDVSSKNSAQLTADITRILEDFRGMDELKVVMPIMIPQQHYSIDELIATANAMRSSIHLFGTVSFNMESAAGPHYVVANGEVSDDMYVFVAMCGSFEPKFRVTSSFEFDEQFGSSAEITEADGPVLKTVNGITTVEFLKSQGMINSDNTVTGTGIWAVPAVLTYPNGTRVVRAFIGVVEGTEYIFSTGAMEAGAKILFSYLDGDKTLASAEKLFTQISESGENGVIAFSCAARSWSLGAEFFAESQKIVDCANDYFGRNGVPLNYCVTYSGGEICPLTDNEGNLINVLHSYTLATCSFC